MSKMFSPQRRPKDLDTAIVYRREDEFCGWPHTSGFWEAADGTLIANFIAIKVRYTSGDAISHDVLGEGGGGASKLVTVRSKDRGKTWDGANPQLNMFGSDRAPAEGTPPTLAKWGPIDYLDRNVLVANGSTEFGKPEARSYVRISKDGARSWTPSVPLPMDNLYSLSAINSSLVRPDGRCLLFMFESSKDGWNRRPLVYGSLPGGTEFHFMSYITKQHDPWGQADAEYDSSFRFGGHRWFYPRGYLLPNGRILCVLRSQRDPRGVMWTEVYASDDGGQTWGFLSRVNDFGSPGSLVQLDDGRLVMVYGQRLKPSGIWAQVSEDGGKSWGSELVIRDDGGSWDLGYPNAWNAGGGKVGVLYYFNSKDDKVQANGGVRHIARSIFSVD